MIYDHALGVQLRSLWRMLPVRQFQGQARGLDFKSKAVTHISLVNRLTDLAFEFVDETLHARQTGN